MQRNIKLIYIVVVLILIIIPALLIGNKIVSERDIPQYNIKMVDATTAFDSSDSILGCNAVVRFGIWNYGEDDITFKMGVVIEGETVEIINVKSPSQEIVYKNFDRINLTDKNLNVCDEEYYYENYVSLNKDVYVDIQIMNASINVYVNQGSG